MQRGVALGEGDALVERERGVVPPDAAALPVEVLERRRVGVADFEQVAVRAGVPDLVEGGVGLARLDVGEPDAVLGGVGHVGGRRGEFEAHCGICGVRR